MSCLRFLNSGFVNIVGEFRLSHSIREGRCSRAIWCTCGVLGNFFQVHSNDQSECTLPTHIPVPGSKCTIKLEDVLVLVHYLHSLMHCIACVYWYPTFCAEIHWLDDLYISMCGNALAR